MLVYTTVAQLQHFLASQKQVVFVPTMGALHDGHIQLMLHGKKLGCPVLASIFVNPTQFNDSKDLEKYPRPLAEDIHLLCKNEIDILFVPPVAEVYPPGIDLDVKVDLTHLTGVLEGPNRPGHFEGVITVVHRLLDIVKPAYLIMGQKDYQQQAIIGEMIRLLKLPVQLIAFPTARASDGLALSSRNVRIPAPDRPKAGILYQSLLRAKELFAQRTPGEIIRECTEMIENTGLPVEYFAIADGETLQAVHEWDEHETIVALVAAWLSGVRLIDNMKLT